MDPETTVWTGRPSHWHYFGWWLLGLLLAAVGVGLLIIAWIFVDRARRTYTVTTRKVVIEWGLFAKSSDEVRIADIRSISVRRRGLPGLLGVGDVAFASAATTADADIVFAAIPDANRIRDLVRKYQAVD
jgi:uncharacterized membrane protein YdbT with pleckstrin-like domain